MAEKIVAGGPSGRGYMAHRNGRLVHISGYRAHTRGPSRPHPVNEGSAEVRRFAQEEAIEEEEEREFFSPVNARHETIVNKQGVKVAKREVKLSKLEARKAKLDSKRAALIAKLAKIDAKDAKRLAKDSAQKEKFAKERVRLDRAERGMRRTLLSYLTGGNRETPIRAVTKGGARLRITREPVRVPAGAR